MTVLNGKSWHKSNLVKDVIFLINYIYLQKVYFYIIEILYIRTIYEQKRKSGKYKHKVETLFLVITHLSEQVFSLVVEVGKRATPTKKVCRQAPPKKDYNYHI